MWSVIVNMILPIGIKLAEQAFAKKSETDTTTGVDRKNFVFQMVRTFIEKLVARGEQNEAISDDAIFGAIEAAFQKMKAAGELTAQVPDLSGDGVFLVKGSVTKL